MIDTRPTISHNLINTRGVYDKTYALVANEELIKVLPKNGEALSTTQISIRLQIGAGTVVRRMKPLIVDGKVQKIQINGKTKGYRIPC